MQFTPLTPEKINELRPFMQPTERFCDYTSGTALIWRDYLDTHYAFFENSLVLRFSFGEENTAYSAPLGGDFRKIFPKMLEKLGKISFMPLSKEQVCVIEELGIAHTANAKRDWCDYLYNACDLCDYTGRKYHGQRNHVNKFTRQYPNWRLVAEINTDNVTAFLDKYYSYKPANDRMSISEKEKVYEILTAPGHYGLSCATLYDGNGNVAAVSCGEVCGDTMFVHIEKGDISFPGVYQVMVQAFARKFCTENVKFINREDDAGIEGLRGSKLSYGPCDLLEKFLVKIL